MCGLGNIGRPLLNLLRTRGFEAVGYDIVPWKTEVTIQEAVKRSDAAIFIVPTPSNPDGSFSNQYLLEAMKAFVLAGCSRDYLFIISSTVVPGSCDKFSELVGGNICYKPEFIRMASVEADLAASNYVLIGEGNVAAGDACAEIFTTLAVLNDSSRIVPVFRMSLIEAELAKITLNCALTMKVSLANQLYLVAERLGAGPKKVMELVGADPRIGPEYLTPGWPYGGPCLPRDNKMFQFVAHSVGLEAPLSMATDAVNRMMALRWMEIARRVKDVTNKRIVHHGVDWTLKEMR